MNNFGKLANYSSHASVNDKYNTYGTEMFSDTREGTRVFIRIKDDFKKKGGKA